MRRCVSLQCAIVRELCAPQGLGVGLNAPAAGLQATQPQRRRLSVAAAAKQRQQRPQQQQQQQGSKGFGQAASAKAPPAVEPLQQEQQPAAAGAGSGEQPAPAGAGSGSGSVVLPAVDRGRIFAVCAQVSLLVTALGFGLREVAPAISPAVADGQAERVEALLQCESPLLLAAPAPAPA